MLLLVRHLFLIANIVTTSKAPVTTSKALVTTSVAQFRSDGSQDHNYMDSCHKNTTPHRLAAASHWLRTHHTSQTYFSMHGVPRQQSLTLPPTAKWLHYKDARPRTAQKQP